MDVDIALHSYGNTYVNGQVWLLNQQKIKFLPFFVSLHISLYFKLKFKMMFMI